jgi:hypothetical protein
VENFQNRMAVIYKRFSTLYKNQGGRAMSEIWKDIPEFEGFYQASNLGRIKRLFGVIKTKKRKRLTWYSMSEKCETLTVQERILSPGKDFNGYFKVNLNKNGKSKNYFVHRLVALAFIPNPENKPQVNHKDLDKINNNLSNLEWVTHQENISHAFANGMRGKLKSKNKNWAHI